MEKTKVGIVTGTRAEYGILEPLMAKIAKSHKLALQVYVSGMHFSKFYGDTKSQISHPIIAEIDMEIKDANSKEDMLNSVSKGIRGFSESFSKNKPDIVVVLGDRIEQYAAALAALFLNIPIVHLHGGEVSGGLDDFIRNMISKMASLHLAATETSAENLKKMGEDKARIRVVGALGLDSIAASKIVSKESLAEKYGLDADSEWAIVIYHPDTMEPEASREEAKNILIMLGKTDYQKIVIYPNADSGSGPVIEEINKIRNEPDVVIFPSIEHQDFISILKHSAFLIGNSSSGIIEAPFLGLPVINVGSRQAGREQGENVVNAENGTLSALSKALDEVTDPKFKEKAASRSPYGDGQASEKILRALEEEAEGKNTIIKNPHHRLYHGK